METWKLVDSFLDASVDRMVEFQTAMTAIPAISPDSGGEGEMKKGKALIQYLEANGLGSVRDYPSDDSRVPGGKRPNLVLKRPGREHDRTIWIMSHLDVVPEGDREKWTGDPFVVRREGDKLIGRGVEDNQQGMVCSIFALKALLENNVGTKHDIGLVFVSDEEVGSIYGIQHLLTHHADLFGKDDLVLVPDSGDSEGSMIETAEKSILWLKVETIGKQCHASRPYNGKNAFRAASELVFRLEGLAEAFPKRDELFDPPISTFEPTKKEANVPNINTLPGSDVFYLDCRVMPGIPLDDVIAWIRNRADEVEKKHGVKIALIPDQKEQAAPPTSPDSPIVHALQDAVRDVYKVQAKAMGIGGGTVAAYFRRAGLAAAVWSRVDETAHQPDEYCRIPHLIGDAKVFARLLATL
ncbi:MAG: M20 family metallo-hydrolase [Candidatus Ozemobacteraceae bacterium]